MPTQDSSILYLQYFSDNVEYRKIFGCYSVNHVYTCDFIHTEFNERHLTQNTVSLSAIISSSVSFTLSRTDWSSFKNFFTLVFDNVPLFKSNMHSADNSQLWCN